MKLLAAIAAALLAAASAADEPAPIGYANVPATLLALRSEPTAQFQSQRGWTVVASREGEHAVEWFFTPEGHPAHPAVVKRVAIERDGIGMIDLAALCHAPQDDCDRLLDDFRQRQQLANEAARVERVLLDVGIAIDEHSGVYVKRLLAEEGKATEIRMDEVFKVVIVPTLDELGRVLLWTAMYEFDGAQFTLLAEPQLASPADGTAEIEITSASGSRFDFSITPLVARE